MASKLIIFAVLATVAQNVFVLSSAASGELPAKSWATLDRINSHMNVIIFEKFTVVKFIANTLRNLTEEIISGEESGSVDLSVFDTTEALERLRNGVDNILTATSIAAETTCATGESFRNAAYGNLETAMSSLESAIELATAGGYPEDKEEFEKIKNEVLKALLEFGQNVVDLIGSCLNPDDRDDVDDVIQTVANGTETSLTFLVECVFNIVYIYGNVVSDANSYDLDSALTGIDSNRVNGLSAIADFLEYVFGAMEAFFLDRTLGGTDIVEILYVSQYLSKRTLNNLNDTYDPIGTTIANTLEKRTNVKEIGRLDYFPSTLANQSASAIGLQIATISALEAIKRTQPLSAAATEAVILVFPAISEVFATTWFDAIVKADDDGLLCNLVPAEIDVIETSQVPLIVSFVETLFVLTGYEGITNPTAQVDTIYHGKTANGFIYEASRYLSRTICANQGATQANFDEIRRLQEQVVINMIEFSKILLKSNLIQVLINHGYTIAGDEPSSSQNSSSVGDILSTASNKLSSLLNQNPSQHLGLRIG